LEADLGLPDDQIQYLATKHQWDLKCRALETGRPFLSQEQAASATQSDADKAERALTLFYLNHPTLKGSNSATRCTGKVIDGNHFVACYLLSIGSRSSKALFLVGKSPDDEVIVAPINGTAMGLVEKTATISTVDNKRLPIATYVGPNLDISAILKQFN
jgi:hypothetical protein